MTIIHSSDLGWTAGQDISDEFAAIAQTFKPGDTFVFDHMYEISGRKIQLPDDFTLAGGSPGAGIDVIDTATNQNPLILLGNANTLVDLTVLHSNTPNTGYDGLSPTIGVDFHNKKTFSTNGKDDISVLNSYFEGNVAIFLDVTEGNNLLIEDTEFNGANQQVRFIGDVDSPVIHNSLFQNALSDGIKTLVGGGSSHTSNATVSESVFLNNSRDGIDTTGGFRDSVIENSYFLRGFTGLDIKEIYDSDDDFAFGEPVNQNILITGSEFINVNNAVVTTTVDRGNYLTSDNATKWAVQDIRLEDSIVENDGTFGRIFLIKDSLNISWDNITLLGPNVTESRLVSDYDIGLPQNISGTNVTTDDQTRPYKGEAYYQSLAGPDWSTIAYPTDGTATPVDPVAEPDPIAYTPPEEPEPVVEAPASRNGAPVANDDVANTGQDTTILVDVLGNDSDPDGDALTLTNVSYTGNTSIVSIENGRIKVNPLSAATEDRVETIVYTVSDGKGGTDTAELKVNVGQVEAPAPQPEPIVEAPEEPEPVVEASVEPEPVVEVIAPETDLAPDFVSQAPDSQLLDVKLFDISTDEALFALNDGAKLSNSDLAGRTITLAAEAINADVEIGSVRLEMDGQYSQMENVEPYALFGDRGGDFEKGIQIPDGTHSVTLTAYSGKNGKGSVLEQVTLSFEIGDYDSILVDGNRSTVSSYSEIQDTGRANVSDDQSTITLEGSAWKSLDLFGEITEETVLRFDFKSDAEGEIQGIGFVSEHGDLETKFFQLDGSQELGIQNFNDAYETGSGFQSYAIPVGEYFTGSADQIVLVNDDDADQGSVSTFSNIGLVEGLA